MESVTTSVFPSRPAGAAAGLLAAGVALGVSELGAGITGGRSLVVSVGDWVINHAPDALVEFGKRNFGTDDKAVLVTTVVMLSLVFGALLGLVARRHFLVGAIGIAAFGVAGFLAALADPLHDAGSAAFAAIAGVAAGVVVLWGLLRAAESGPTAAIERASPAGFERRAFLGLAAGAAVVAAGSALIGRSLLTSGTRAVAAARHILHLPPASSPVAPPTAAMDVGVDGITPLVTSNRDFYRIDTALTFPQIDYEQWHLHIHGMVSNPFTVTFDDLAAMELIEQYATIQCVSNYVGGNLVSTAAWRGVRLRDLLARAGVAGDADQVVGRSVEGFTVGFPTSAALDDRGAMVAIGMNGVPLPIEHGFPARLDRARPLRLRLRDEMALRHRAHPVRPVRRGIGSTGDGHSKGPSRRSRGSTSPPRDGSYARRRSRSRVWRGHRPAASPRSKCRSTKAPGTRPCWPTR